MQQFQAKVKWFQPPPVLCRELCHCVISGLLSAHVHACVPHPQNCETIDSRFIVLKSVINFEAIASIFLRLYYSILENPGHLKLCLSKC